MQQGCTWIMVHLIWYRVILPCWCNFPIWIPFGFPVPKLDIWSPQGVSVLINVASPNSRALIQLWFDQWHICLTPPLPHTIPSISSASSGANFLSVSLCSCIHTASKNSPRIWCFSFTCDAGTCEAALLPFVWRTKSHHDMLRKDISYVWTPPTGLCQCCDDTWDIYHCLLALKCCQLVWISISMWNRHQLNTVWRHHSNHFTNLRHYFTYCNLFKTAFFYGIDSWRNSIIKCVDPWVHKSLLQFGFSSVNLIFLKSANFEKTIYQSLFCLCFCVIVQLHTVCLV